MRTSINRLFLLLSIAVFLQGMAFAETRIERDIAKGVHYMELHRAASDGKPLAIYVIKLDRNAPNLRYRTTKGTNHVLGWETIRSQALRLSSEKGNVVAAVNGDFSFTDPVYYGLPIGPMVMQQELLTGPYLGRPALGIGAKGELQFGIPALSGKIQAGDAGFPINLVNKSRSGTGELILYTRSFGLTTKANTPSTDAVIKDLNPPLPLKPGVTYTGTVAEIRKGTTDSPLPSAGVLLSGTRDAATFLETKTPVGATVSFTVGFDSTWNQFEEVIGVWPVMVRGGKVILSAVAGEAFEKARHPRTAIGWNDQSLFLVAVDGRQPGYSMGMNLYELADLMLELGCMEATNMDGGGSTTMLVRGDVMNQPSDGVDRKVSNGLAIIDTTTPGPLYSLRVVPENPSMLAGSHLQFGVVGTDDAWNPVPVDPSKVKWSVKNTLGTIDAAGNFTATTDLRSGMVTASVGEIVDATTANVWPTPAMLRIVPGKLEVPVNGSAQLSVQAFDTSNKPIAMDPSAVCWTVAGEGVILGSDGKLAVGPKPGSFTVTATVAGVSTSVSGRVIQPTPAESPAVTSIAPALH